MIGEEDSVRYFYAQSYKQEQMDFPKGKSIPFGWNAVAISTCRKRLRLNWNDELNSESIAGNGYLRISIALDVREEKLIEVFLPNTGEILGIFDIRYAHVFQIFELAITKAQIEQIKKQGLEFIMTKGTSPLWLFFEQSEGSKDLIHLPHIVFKTVKNSNQSDQLIERMSSITSIQQFGWMEGCVLDGLIDLYDTFGVEAFKEAVKKHIDMYVERLSRIRDNASMSRRGRGKRYSSSLCDLGTTI